MRRFAGTWLVAVVCMGTPKYVASDRQLFLMLQAARSGSDWLMSLLNVHPSVCMPAGRVKVPKGHDPTVLVSKLRVRDEALRGGNVTDAFETSANERVSLALDENDKCRAFGWKQGLWMAKAYATDDHRAEFAEWLRRRRVKVIMLQRVSLARVISGAKNHFTPNATLLGTEASRNVHCTSRACVDTVKTLKVTLDPRTIRKTLEAHQNEWDTVLRWARTLPETHKFHITYDDLVADTTAHVGRLYDFLGVGPMPRGKDPRTSMLKSGGGVAESIENVRGIRAALDGTVWASELTPAGAGPRDS